MAEERETIKIQVIVRTKDTDCAGTDANVFVTLIVSQLEKEKSFPKQRKQIKIN